MSDVEFTPNDDQQAIIDLATRIVDDHTEPDRLRRLDDAGSVHDDELWAALAAADLVGLGLPSEVSGGGLGLLEAALVAEAIGRGPGAVPYTEVVAAGRALARSGDDAGSAVATGEIVVPALGEGPTAAVTSTPTTTASADGDRWRLTGDKRLVPGATPATAVLVSARSPDGAGLYVVDRADVPDSDIVESTSTTGQVLTSIALDGTPARRLSGDGTGALSDLHHDLGVLRCALLAGVAAGALDLAADHGTTREQFGSPIGTFQAVAHRLADAWLDTNLMAVTARQAAWRTDNGLPARQAAASAGMWATEGVQRVVHAAQHIHGGVGMDLDYPVHRFFRWAKDVELQLGGPAGPRRELGRLVADEPLAIG